MDIEPSATLVVNAQRAVPPRPGGAGHGSSAGRRPVLQLKGDASNRSYLRVGRWPDSHVVMVMPPGPPKSEEASKGGPPDELPFLNVQRYLDGLGVRVPRILRYDTGAAMMVLEDLGDLTFERALESGSREALYGRAVDLLARMRAAADARPDPGCLAFTRAFDEELYTWELHHFREYGLEAWSGRPPPRRSARSSSGPSPGSRGRLAAAPRGFTHRDYQSRNLMVTARRAGGHRLPGRPAGPVAVRPGRAPPRTATSSSRRARRRDDRPLAAGVRTRCGPAPRSRRAFRQFFDLLTVQRKLKDAARFEFIHRVKKNPGFLPSIPASLRYARAAMERLADDRGRASRSARWPSATCPSCADAAAAPEPSSSPPASGRGSGP